MRVVIAAAGPGTRWNGYNPNGGEPIPKHLIEINGERLIDRTVRLFREAGVEDIVITAPPGDYRYEVEGTRVVEKLPDPVHQVDRFLPCEVWNPDGHTLFVYGDAYYSQALVERMARHEPPGWAFHVRLSRKPWRGIVRNRAVHGFAFDSCAHRYLSERIASLVKLQREGKVQRSLGLDLYRWMSGEEVDQVKRSRGDSIFRAYPGHAVLQPRDDVSTDFDWPKDYDAFMAVYDPESDQ